MIAFAVIIASGWLLSAGIVFLAIRESGRPLPELQKQLDTIEESFERLKKEIGV